MKQEGKRKIKVILMYSSVGAVGDVFPSVTGQLADTPTRGLPLADWTSRELVN